MFLSGKNSAPSAAGRGKDALKRLGWSIKYHRVLSGPARKFANTIPLDIDGNTDALQYFRFEPLHSQGNPIPIHAQARRQNAGPPAKVFGREGRGEGEPFSKKVSLPASFSFFKYPGPACRPQNKKSPAERGQKKTPSRCELQGGLEQSLAAAYFPT